MSIMEKIKTPEPQIDDIDSQTGESKYKNYEEYHRDLRVWDRKQAVKEAGNKWAMPSLSMGSALAMILSFELNHSIWWAVVHGICSWVYVIYRAWQGNY